MGSYLHYTMWKWWSISSLHELLNRKATIALFTVGGYGIQNVIHRHSSLSYNKLFAYYTVLRRKL